MACNLLKGKKGIIFGALNQSSIAWKVAEKAYNEGAELIFSNAPSALKLGELHLLSEKINAPIIPADATSIPDLEHLFSEATKHFDGQIDFLLHSIGMSPNVRKHKPYTDLNYDWYMKSIDVSAFSFHKIMKVAYDNDVMKEYGSIVALSYIASQRLFPDYGDMAQAKAVLESIARSFGYEFAKKNKVRVNTISQSPTPTTAGKGVGGFQDFIEIAEKMSPLGNASAEDCADYCLTLFSDYTRKVTMQNLMHDGGFSMTGITSKIQEELSKNNNLKD